MEIANGISRLRSYTDTEFFRATCGCMSEDHDRTIILEKDEDGIVSCTIYANLKYYDWGKSQSNVFSKAWSRIKAAVRILTTGYIEFQGEFMFDSDEAAKDYAEAILSTIDKLKVKNEPSNS